jgi:leucyl aminopeptidase
MEKIKVSARSDSPHQVKADLLAIPVFQSKTPIKDLAVILGENLAKKIAKWVEWEKFTGEKGSQIGLFTKELFSAQSLLLFGLGERSKWELENLRRACAQITKSCLKKDIGSLAMVLPRLDASAYRYGASPAEMAQVMTEGALLGTYRFDKYQIRKEAKPSLDSIVLLTPEKELLKPFSAGIERGIIFAHATALARDLVNEPPSTLTPRKLSAHARETLKGTGIQVRILTRREIAALKMNAYLAVSLGSKQEPVMIRMDYNPGKKTKEHTVIVGKGITFDSGGLSLKNAKSMETMKDDMAGAAAVLGTMVGLSRIKPPIRVTGLILATENMPGGGAIKPGDVVKAFNGKTIEILNTDAEGRLTLADGLAYAETLQPKQIVDLATLTGACLVALGSSMSAIMGNSPALIQNLRESGERCGEPLWELPLFEDYRELIKSDIAHIKNTGGSYGGTITAGLFLSEFVQHTDWAHLDIAGPAWSEKDSFYYSKGGTGVGVRTLLDYLCSR